MTYCVSDFVNHFAMDGLRWAISPKLNPAPNEQSGAPAKLRVDTENLWKKHIYGFSVGLRDYGTLSSFGEAQYAPDKAKWCIVGLPAGTNHAAAYKYCTRYAMSEWDEAAKVFSHSWGGSFGGEKWYQILHHCYEWQQHFNDGLLGKWIDHYADLEHNSKGGLFNKSTPEEVLKRDLSKDEINSFLDWKLKCKNVPLAIYSSEWSRYIRPPVRMLIERYVSIWHPNLPKVVWSEPVAYHMQTPPVLSPIQWGNEKVVLAKTSKGMNYDVVPSSSKALTYKQKALSLGVSLEQDSVGGIPESLMLVMGKLWMYAITNDGKE